MSLSIEEKLPTELLEQIVSLVPRNSLLSLCLTSKTLSQLATPCLYSEIYLRETDNLAALAYLVFTSPAHASLVKSFIVPRTWADVEERYSNGLWPGSDDPGVHDVLRKKCSEYTSSVEEAEDVYGKIQSAKNEDAVMALLLPNLPKLRRLNINCDLYGHDDFVSWLPKVIRGIASRRDLSADNSPSPSKNGQQGIQPHAVSESIDILIAGGDDKYSSATNHVAVFFCLPNVRSIYGWKHGDSESHDENDVFPKLEPQSCPVEYLELRCAKLDLENFQGMLNATIPGRLKTFNYELGGSWAWCDTEHPAMMRSLEPHNETLEALGLSHEDFYPYLDDESAERGKAYPCSFSSFAALRRLKVAPVYIWGHRGITDEETFKTAESRDRLWSTLPKSLQEFWITRAQNQHIDHKEVVEFVPRCLLPALDLVVQNKQTAFPQLVHLRVELPLLDWKDEWLDSLASTCKAANAHQIRTTIILCDMFDKYGRITSERDWGWNEDIKWEPSRYSQNRECAKVWVEATPQRQEHLASILKDMKPQFQEENERYKEMQAEINKLGALCTHCQLSGEYDSSKGIGLPERFIDERLGDEPYWKGRGGKPDVVT
ncbi:hypothetical protein BKA58DRAFT_732 [Alternaria rosae]|uniref:uncharacterized protein n=1 Tax=Alternaria rosae TaxID=1187941 RepID=UPI001E8E53F3|nr:uncharacterized protein BKA58DRAFT_732 [Alternaria rosae]KAH6881318.1 hypothetical protein BKA58DRAFT_732 [Alternaria rosae]